MDALRIIPRSAPFYLRFLGALVVIGAIAIAAWWYYGMRAEQVEEIFREANSGRVVLPLSRTAA
ncbi:MAG TPA: hypothetical protein VK013_06455 [Myxococcaceae bacterium]|nr:hypothetical protein [Myxococcaceae bacterium]